MRAVERRPGHLGSVVCVRPWRLGSTERWSRLMLAVEMWPRWMLSVDLLPRQRMSVEVWAVWLVGSIGRRCCGSHLHRSCSGPRLRGAVPGRSRRRRRRVRLWRQRSLLLPRRRTTRLCCRAVDGRRRAGAIVRRAGGVLGGHGAVAGRSAVLAVAGVTRWRLRGLTQPALSDSIPSRVAVLSASRPRGGWSVPLLAAGLQRQVGTCCTSRRSPR